MRLIFKTKFHDWFPRGQFFIEGYHTPFSLDQDGNGGGILLYVCKVIPARNICYDSPTSESFYVETILHKIK